MAKIQRKPPTARGQQTRQRILEVTRDLMGQSATGYVSVDQIAEQAQVAKTSIFWHFGSKEALVLEVFDSTIASFATSFAVSSWRPDQSWDTMLTSLLDQIAEFVESQRGSLRIAITLCVQAMQADSPMGERVRRMLADYRQWIHDHCPPVPGMDRHAVAVALLGLFVGIVMQWQLDDNIDIRHSLHSVVPNLKALLPILA